MVVGSGDREGLSNPFDQEQDYGPTAFDTRHTFVMSAVIAPQSDNAILDNNQLGLIIQANSGLPFNVRSNQGPEQRRLHERPAERRHPQQ